jgi:hypothetical protein
MPSIRWHDRPMPNLAMEREMIELCARLGAMETTKKWTTDAGDVSESKNENVARPDEEEVAVEDVAEERIFRVVARIVSRENMDITMYKGNLYIEELLDWFRALDKYFDY